MLSTTAKFSCLLALSMLLFTSQTGAQADPSPPLATVLPLVPYSKWQAPMVEIKLNGTLTAKFLLDTGTNTSVVSDKIASALGLSPQPAVKEGHPYLMGGKQGHSVVLSQMQIGGFLLSQPIPMIVAEKRQLFGLSPLIDGILGTNILSLFTIRMDFAEHQVTLWSPGGLSTDEIKDIGMSGTNALIMTQREDGLYTVPGVFSSGASQIPKSLLVDTGAAETSVSKNIARQLHLESVNEQANDTYWGSINYTQTQVDIQAGDIKRSDFPVNYVTDGDIRFPCGLGMDILSSYRVLMDFPAKKMYLQTNTPSVNITVKPQTPAGAAGK